MMQDDNITSVRLDSSIPLEAKWGDHAKPQHLHPGSISICSSPTARTTRHRPHPWHAGRQDRAEPTDERDARDDGVGAVQVVVRGLRPRVRAKAEGRAPGLPKNLSQ